jgi:hypothetical protein
MATLKDLLDSGMSRDEINALLSQGTVGTEGFQAQGFMGGEPYMPPPQAEPQQPPRFAVGEDGLSRMTDRPGEVEQAPMNTIRNNSTGVVTQMPSSGRRSHDVWADGPQEIGRKQLADGTTEIIRKIPVMRDGRQSVGMERLIETPDYLNPAKIKQLEYQKREAEVRNLNGPQESTYDKELAKERAKAGVWSVVESAGKQYMLNNKTGEIKPAVVNNAQLPAKADAAAKPTEDENKTAYHASKMLDSINRISQLSNKSKDAMTPGLTEAMAASTAGPYSGTANVARSGDRQAVFGLQTDLVDSLLYLATGAAYNKEQLDQKRESLLPSFTDKPEAIAEKKRSLQEYMKAAKIRSGKAWKPEMEAALNSIYADGAESPKAKAPPANGTVKGGYVFIGGDPAKESSWKKVQ